MNVGAGTGKDPDPLADVRLPAGVAVEPDEGRAAEFLGRGLGPRHVVVPAVATPDTLAAIWEASTARLEVRQMNNNE